MCTVTELEVFSVSVFGLITHCYGFHDEDYFV